MELSLELKFLFGPSLVSKQNTVVVSRKPTDLAALKDSERLLPGEVERLNQALGSHMINPVGDQVRQSPTWVAVFKEIIELIAASFSFAGHKAIIFDDGHSVGVIGPNISVSHLCAETAMLFWKFSRNHSQLSSAELAARWGQARDLLKKAKLNPQLEAIYGACTDLDVPCFQFLSEPRYVHLGEGFRRQLLHLMDTAQTSHFGVKFAKDKMMTNRLLAASGIPVPKQVPVQSPEQAWQAAVEIGLPVVVKPVSGNHANGVSVNVKTKDELLAAIAKARTISQGVILEAFIPGNDYRVIVSGNRIIGLNQRRFPVVIGDGIHTVEDLMEIHNRAKKFPDEMVAPLSPSLADKNLLSKQGISITSIPLENQQVQLSPNLGRRFGGANVHVEMNGIHPDNTKMLVRASAVLGLNISGIDFRIEDISQSWRSVRSGICEINTASGLYVMLIAKPDWVRESLIPEVIDTKRCRIPHIVVARPAKLAAEADHFCSALAEDLGRTRGWETARLLQNGLFLGNYPAGEGLLPLHRLYRQIIECPFVNAAVYSIDPQRIEKEGLGIQRIDCLLEYGPADQWMPQDRKIVTGIAAILNEPVVPIADGSALQRVAGEISARWPASTFIGAESGRTRPLQTSHQL